MPSILVTVAGGSLAAALLTGGPALAHDGAGSSAPAAKPACTATLPLTVPCTATVSNSGSNYTVTLPGVGTLTFSLDAAGNVTDPTVAGTENGFTASTPKADGDGVTATFTNAATDPAKTQQYKVDVDVHPADTASTEPKVTANVRSADDHHCDGDHDGNRDTHDTDSDAASAHTLAQRTSSDGAQHDSWHRDGDRHRDGRRSGRR